MAVGTERQETPWAVTCDEHGLVFLTQEEYSKQMKVPSKTWRCPICREEAIWDDENYEKHLENENPHG